MNIPTSWEELDRALKELATHKALTPDDVLPPLTTISPAQKAELHEIALAIGDLLFEINMFEQRAYVITKEEDKRGHTTDMVYGHISVTELLAKLNITTTQT